MKILPEIHADIRKASTLPGWFYTDGEIFQKSIEKVFSRSWQWICRADEVRVPSQIYPFSFLEKALDEPLLFTRDSQGTMHALSNVCTHRGNLLCPQPGIQDKIRCRYHGRRFGLNGKLEFMPEFDQVEGFPGENDHLPRVPFGEWGGMLFAALNPESDFEKWLEPIRKRLSWLPVEEFVFDPSRSRDYLVKANWALYVDNYLEGFHIPFVHPGLSQSLDYGAYRHELFEGGNLQLGIARSGELAFDLPPESPDFGEEIGAYYYWLFPNLMLNFYPWGLSLNVVKPLTPELTRVRFLSFVWKPELLGQGAGSLLDKVEREDEEIVENVQRGVKSSLYTRGRYSPQREQGVHQFHRLLFEVLG
ncbi:MAG: aromatic ring-hydroxylating dioxygenase subunit alpha [Bacteroidia bacterium]|nr:aromatic ring-hydroxylating dioxygenase subunit alpha [Bacteroidia bacterium]